MHLAAKQRLLAGEPGPLFLADWDRAAFLHFAVPPAELQSHTPFPLDLWQGEAVVTLVAFTMRRMRFAGCERWSERLLWPFREQRFLNLRTYVRVKDEPGITFLAEWISSATQALVGPAVYGLPYRWGAHDLEHDGDGSWSGCIRERGRTGAYSYQVAPSSTGEEKTAVIGSFAEFALERHTCFLRGARRHRRFRIWHEPWRQQEAVPRIIDDSLVHEALPWWTEAKLVGAQRSSVARDVWMGRPFRL